MKLKRKSVFYLAGGALGLILILVLLRFALQGQYTNKIPEPPQSSTLSDAVRKQIAESSKDAKRKPSAENLGELGMVYHSSANYQEAAACYRLAIDRDPEQWLWSYYLGFLSMEMGQSEKVIDNFTRVIEINPEIYHAWYYCGEAHMNLRSYEQAEKYFTRISGVPRAKPGGETTRIDHFPLGIYAKYQLSILYFDSKRLDLAEKTANEILNADKLFGPAYRLLGNIYRARGDDAIGNQYSLRANDIMVVASPVDALIDRLVLLSRSELYVLKKIDEASLNSYSDWAMTIIDNALIYLPDNRYLIAKAIKTWLWFDFDDKAIALSEQYLSFAENTYAELFEAGNLFFQKEQYSQAIKYFTRLEEMKPGVTETREKLAISLWRVDERQMSLDILDQILESFPHNMEVLADVTDLMIFDLGEVEISSSYLKILKHFLPLDPKVQKMSTNEAEKNGKPLEAVTLYEASFKGDPEDITTIKKLGELLIGQKMWTRAIKLYEEALDYHSNYPVFLEGLGTLLIACPDHTFRDIEKGLEYSERAFVHSASNPNVKIDSGKSLALAYINQENLGKANSLIGAAITIATRYAPERVPELEKIEAQLK